MARSWLRLLLVWLASTSVAMAVAPPPRLTDAHKERLKRQEELLSRAEQASAAGKQAETMQLVRQALDIEREVFTEVRPSRLSVLDWLAEQHEFREEFAKASRARKEVLELCVQYYGAADWRAITARWAVKDVGHLARMRQGQRQKLVQARQNNDHSRELLRQGNLGKGVQFAEEAVKLHQEVLGDKHPSYAFSLHNLAALYQEMGDHKQALTLFRQTVGILKAALGEKHPNYATSLHRLAFLYQDMGDHKQALTLFRQTVAILKGTVGEKYPQFATSLHNLALLYQEMGDHKQALFLSLQALAIIKESLGDKHPDYAANLNSLALLYKAMGDYKQALPLLQQALAARKAVLGKKPLAYATSLNNLASLYEAMGNYKQALPLLQQALAVREAALGKKHPAYTTSLNNLAVLHQNMGYHKQALSLFLQASAIIKATLGEKHPHYAMTLNNLATLYKAMGNPKQALILLLQTREIFKVAPGEKHPDYATILYNLALLYQATGKPYHALPLCGWSLSLTRQHLQLCASVQSERQQLASAHGVRHHLDLLLTLSAAMPELSGVAHEAVLAAKGAVFLQQQQQHLLRQQTDPAVRLLFVQLQDASREFATLALHTPTPATQATRQRRLEELSRLKEALESTLSHKSESFRRQRQRLTSADLQRFLPAGAVLVDFFRYWHSEPGRVGKKRSHWQLTAFVLRRDMGVVRVDLGPAAAVEQAVADWLRSLGTRHSGRAAGATLRQLVWLPLEAQVRGAKMVLLSTDGALARLPFGALPGAKPDSYLIEEVALAVVPVPQLLPQLLEEKPAARQTPPSLLLVGDVDFDAVAGKPVFADARHRSVPDGSWRHWSKLPATLREVAAIKDTFGTQFEGSKLTDLVQKQASKQAVRQGLISHRFAHLATHGFFAPGELKSALAGKAGGEGERFGREGVAGWHPLLLSGVVLAGANREAPPGQEDGVLTALEVADLDLGGCELVTLSACETGLGEVAGGEGVLGLQRAFQAAGARTVVTSLWNVPDRATAALMAAFYRNLWQEKKGKLEALRQAQLEVMRGPGESSNPEFWAAWVLSGEPGEFSAPPLQRRQPPPSWNAWAIGGCLAAGTLLTFLAWVCFKHRARARCI